MLKSNVGHMLFASIFISDLKQKISFKVSCYITFEAPGRRFTYTDDAYERLTSDAVEELIQQLSNYRDTPKLWSI